MDIGFSPTFERGDYLRFIVILDGRFSAKGEPYENVDVRSRLQLAATYSA